MNGGSSVDIYILPCVQFIAEKKLLYNTGSLAWCSVITERSGVGVGREVQEGGVYI